MIFAWRKLGSLAGTSAAAAVMLGWAASSTFAQSGSYSQSGPPQARTSYAQQDDGPAINPPSGGANNSPDHQTAPPRAGSPNYVPSYAAPPKPAAPQSQQSQRYSGNYNTSNGTNAGPAHGQYTSNSSQASNASPTRPAGGVARTSYQDDYYTPNNAQHGPNFANSNSRTRLAMVDGSSSPQPHMANGSTVYEGMPQGSVMPPDGMPTSGQSGGPEEGGCGCNGGGCGCNNGSCGCNNGCGNCCCCCFPFCWWHDEWIRDLSFAGGVQSWKTPAESFNFPTQGHFGVDEQLNWGTPIWDAIGLGGQISADFVQSDLTSEEQDFTGSRHQTFLTAGLFHRADCDSGLQGGVVYDYLRDEHVLFNESATLGQLRGEIGYVYQCHEIGADVSLNLHTATLPDATTEVHAVDLYSVYYVHRSCSGAEARVWAGYANGLGGLVGGDFDAPLSDRISLDANFATVIPGGATDGDTNRSEAWSLGINLVWHPGACGHDCGCGSYRPLFDPANNGNFIVNEHVR